MGYLIIARWGAMDFASRCPPRQVNSGFLIIFELSKRPRVSYRKLKLSEPSHFWVTLEPLWGHFGDIRVMMTHDLTYKSHVVSYVFNKLYIIFM